MKNHNLSIAVLTVFFLSIFSLNAQESVNSSGADIKSPNGTISYSIGQVAYTQMTGEDNSELQGVQQPYEISEIISTIEIKAANVDVTLYPNPSSGIINLTFKNIELNGLSYQLIDLEGNLISVKTIKGQETHILMNELPAGTYFLKIRKQDNNIATYKIIKY